MIAFLVGFLVDITSDLFPSDFRLGVGKPLTQHSSSDLVWLAFSVPFLGAITGHLFGIPFLRTFWFASSVCHFTINASNTFNGSPPPPLLHTLMMM